MLLLPIGFYSLLQFNVLILNVEPFHERKKILVEVFISTFFSYILSIMFNRIAITRTTTELSFSSRPNWNIELNYFNNHRAVGESAGKNIYSKQRIYRNYNRESSKERLSLVKKRSSRAIKSRTLYDVLLALRVLSP